MPYDFKIPLLQRIFLFACNSCKDAFALSTVSSIFYETAFDYNAFFFVVENTTTTRTDASGNENLFVSTFSKLCTSGCPTSVDNVLKNLYAQWETDRLKEFLRCENVLRLAISSLHFATVEVAVHHLKKCNFFSEAMLLKYFGDRQTPIVVVITADLDNVTENDTQILSLLLSAIDDDEIEKKKKKNKMNDDGGSSTLFEDMIFCTTKKDHFVSLPMSVLDALSQSSNDTASKPRFLTLFSLVLDYFERKGLLKDVLEAANPSSRQLTVLHALTFRSSELCHLVIERARKTGGDSFVHQLLESRCYAGYTPLMTSARSFQSCACTIAKMFIGNFASREDFLRHLNIEGKRHTCRDLIGSNRNMGKISDALDADLWKKGEYFDKCKAWYEVKWRERGKSSSTI